MIHSTRQAISSGTTAESFGTSVNFDLDNNARKVVAILDIGVDPIYTTAEGAAGILRCNSSSLGLTNEEFLTGPYTSSGPGTNSSGQAQTINIIPIDWPVVGGETIAIDIAPTAAITTARLHETALLWNDDKEELPDDWMSKFPGIVQVGGGQVDAAQQLTVTRTALAALTIPSWVEEIVGMKAGMLKEGAITAGEEITGFFEFISSIPGLAPLNIPTGLGSGATLGTPVGTGLYFDKIPWVPIYIKGTGKQETITPFVTLRTAVTTGNNVFVQVAYR